MNLNVPVGGEESTDEPEQSFAEDRGSDTWDILYQLFLRTDDRLIHQHAGRKTSNGGVIALVCWCVYFLPIGILAYRHFSKQHGNT